MVSKLNVYVTTQGLKCQSFAMAVPPQALVNRNKKHFLGIPAPLGYVAGVGRGYFSNYF